jgi:hypothetical protein
MYGLEFANGGQALILGVEIMCIDILVEENVCLYIEIFFKNPILENTQDGEKWGEN